MSARAAASRNRAMASAFPGGSGAGTRRPKQWPPRGPARVMLVLDQPVIIEMVKLSLSHGAYDARTASNSTEAAALLNTWRPHLVLMDMHLDAGEIIDQIGAKPAGGARLPS